VEKGKKSHRTDRGQQKWGKRGTNFGRKSIGSRKEDSNDGVPDEKSHRRSILGLNQRKGQQDTRKLFSPEKVGPPYKGKNKQQLGTSTGKRTKIDRLKKRKRKAHSSTG